jgi:2-amino-4-hydroxy-6-hydroxymethyldihydropteridine diphosphokinase
MEVCYVALGANLGPALQTVKAAFELIAQHPAIQQARLSTLYETRPVSPICQPNFINAVCEFKTDLNIEILFNYLESVECMLGKQPKSKLEPRLIDLDLLFYGQHTYQSPTLTIPHPRWAERSFVLKPLADLTDQFNAKEKLQHIEDVCLLPL